MEGTGNKADEVNPRRCLYPYQLKWIEDESRFKAWNKSRQIGGTFACAFEVVEDCYQNKTDWVVLSASEDTAGEFLRNAEKAERAFKLSLEFLLQSKIPDAKVTASEIEFYNGSRILVLPANPRTARSYSANVVLDEFAHHQNSDLIWDATYPIITNPLNGTLKMRVLSSPNGITNLFYKLMYGDNDFSKHTTTIHQAKSDGLNINIDELKRNCLTDVMWRQNFECEFLDLAVFEPVIPRQSIEACLNNPPLPEFGSKVAFIDFGGGVAENVIAYLEGNSLKKIIAWVESDTMNAAGRCVAECRALGVVPQCCFVDATNGTIGHALADKMAELGYAPNRVDNGHGAYLKDRYANRGAEMWFDARDQIEKRKVILLNDEKTIAQMCSRAIKYPSGKMGLEKKEDMKSRGLMSPDRADAVCGVISCAKYMKPQLSKFDQMWKDLERNVKKVDTERLKGMYAG